MNKLLSKENLDLLISVLLIVAALNWGTTAYFDTDMVQKVFQNPDVEKIVKGVVGVAGLVAGYGLFMQLSQK